MKTVERLLASLSEVDFRQTPTNSDRRKAAAVGKATRPRPLNETYERNVLLAQETRPSSFGQSRAPSGADAMVRRLTDVVARIPEGASVSTLTAAQELELVNWEAEKYRQSPNRPTGAA
jgi:hypothetical protein